MLLAHGTTRLNADRIESDGYFQEKTYFLKLSPDMRLGIFGTAGFALRDNPKTEGFIDLYCNQDLMIRPFRNGLKSVAKRYTESKKGDDSPGLIYIVDTIEDPLDYHRGLRSFFIPNELFSTARIPTSTIRRIMCLEEEAEIFSSAYGYPVETLDSYRNDDLATRLYHTMNSRFQRLIMGRK